MIKQTEPFFLQLHSSVSFPSSDNMEFIRDQIYFNECVKLNPNINKPAYCQYEGSEPIYLAISQTLLGKLKWDPFISA